MNDRNQIVVFDRAQVRRQRNRAAACFADHRVLFEEAAAHLIERAEDVARPFHNILDLGTRDGLLAQHFAQSQDSFVVAADYAESMLQSQGWTNVMGDEEFLPFAANSFDLIASNLHLHWTNDLPGALLQIKQALQPDGLFLASMLGGETLYELRTCLMEAELAVTGGVSPRLSPVLDLPTASALLQRAGFALPVVDQESCTFLYRDMFELMHDLRGMGDGNAHVYRLRQPTRRALFFEAARLYQERFADPSGGVQARFDVLFLHGWKTANTL